MRILRSPRGGALVCGALVCGALVCGALLTGCAAPFDLVKSAPASGPVAVRSCGASELTAEGLVQTLDSPPAGPDTEVLPPPKDLVLCLELHNRGARPVQVDRSLIQLQAPRERQGWVPDRQDDRLVVPPGLRRRFRVTFQYSPLRSGEELRVILGEALRIAGRPVEVSSLVLRRR